MAAATKTKTILFCGPQRFSRISAAAGTGPRPTITATAMLCTFETKSILPLLTPPLLMAPAQKTLPIMRVTVIMIVGTVAISIALAGIIATPLP